MRFLEILWCWISRDIQQIQTPAVEGLWLLSYAIQNVHVFGKVPISYWNILGTQKKAGRWKHDIWHNSARGGL